VTLTVHTKLIQGSDEWMDQRRGIITASAVGRLITPKTVKPASNPESRSLTTLLAAERITGWTDPTYINDDMMRGTLNEPIAREKYAEHYAPVTECGFMVEDKWNFQIGFSPDGLVGDEGLLEIKSRRAKNHFATIISDEVPLENMAQLMCGLLVSGREFIDYVSYTPGMPLFVKRVYPQQKWFDAIIQAVTEFEENVAVMIRTYERLSAELHQTERLFEQGIAI
jgi:hypothetical protein